jgi:hypothetical protein
MKFISINFMKNYRIYFTRAMAGWDEGEELAPAGLSSSPKTPTEHPLQKMHAGYKGKPQV